MRTQFKIGQSVTLLDDDLSGIITQISAEAISIITSDGFEFDVNAHEIVPDKTLDLDFDQNLDLIRQKQKIFTKVKDLDQKVAVITKKLKNKSFLQNAPKQIIEKDKKALIDYKFALKKLNSILNSIKN